MNGKNSGGQYYKRRNFKQGPRKNERIRAKEVRLLDPEGTQLGVVPISEALKLSKEYRLDLVEVSAAARPPVCRILDYGKYMYTLSKREKSNKSKSPSSKVKEIKLRLNIDHHDYMTKIRHAEEFLYHGNKVKVTLTFRGRENEHRDLGKEVVDKSIKDLAHIGAIDSPPRFAGRNLTVTISALAENKRQLIHNKSGEKLEEKKEVEESSED